MIYISKQVALNSGKLLFNFGDLNTMWYAVDPIKTVLGGIRMVAKINCELNVDTLEH